MRTTYWLLLGFIFIGYSCGTVSTTGTAPQKDQLKRMVEEKMFVIDSEWARPNVSHSMMQIANSGLLPYGSNAGNISLIGNQNFLEVKKDSVSLDLPYYGERQMGGGYTNNVGYEYAGAYADYSVVYVDKNQCFVINFTIEIHTEVVQITIRLFDNLQSDIIVNSSHRRPISYAGMVTAIVDKKKD